MRFQGIFRKNKICQKHAQKQQRLHVIGISFFDGNHKRAKHYVTLTTSAYHPLLCKKVALVTMQCKQEGKGNIEIFWPVFNKAYKEANNQVHEKFHPKGWCTDIASCNFIGLVKIYGEDVLQYIKGCELHFRDSVNRH